MNLAVIGASGEVGRMMIKVLQENSIQPESVDFYSSSKSAGKSIKFYEKKYIIKELNEDSLKRKYDYILMSAGGNVSKRFSPIAEKYGSTIIDNSSAFRSDDTKPLVVPEINGKLLKDYYGIIANPNCSTIQMVLNLYKIHQEFGISKIVVSTYQAASGAGKKGIEELEMQEKGIINPKVFSKQLFENVVPKIGTFLESGFSTEEMKMVNETQKILEDKSIDIWPTTVRVPVLYGHSESIYIETKKEFVFDDIINKLEESEHVKVTTGDITPLEIAGSNITYVSRIRTFNNKSVLFWNVADNIRVGAATNAVRILIKHRELNK